MKFLCPSCKAKYQIADEKVSGRSVRMKCRKCGFIIPISQVPPAPTTLQPAEGELMSVVPKPPPPAQVTVQDVIAAPPKPERANTHAKLPAKLGAATPVPRPPSSPSAAPRPLSSPSAAPRPLTPPPGARAPTPKPRSAPGAPAAESKPPAPTGPAAVVPPLDEVDDDDATRIVSNPYASSPLASAFTDLVGATTSTIGTGLDAAMPADEWFVGVNDVPVGPIRLAELRSKALSGAVTLDSLVWRDGQEDWRPLRTFPELVAIVEEGVSSIRASLGPLPAPPPQTAAKVEVSDPFARAAATGVGVVTDDVATAGITRSRTPMAAWIAMVVALACGVTIGFVFFSSQKPPETIVKYVEVPAKAAEAPATPAAQAAAETETANGTTPTGPTKPRGTGNLGAKGTSGDATKAASETKGGLSGLKGLSGLGPSGPAGTPGGEGAAKSGGGELDAAQLQSTVARYTSSVKRSCWQPALDARDPNAPTSARVVVSVTVGPSGSVSAVNTGADPKGYPGLSRCIAQRVKAWQFPPSSGTTTVNVPFVFAAQ